MARKSIKPAQKAKVKSRAQSCCEYCFSQEDFSPDTFSVEHIHPISKGGTNALHNLAYACQQCNSHKYTSTESLDLLTGEIVPLYNPRQDQWATHFAWSEDFIHIVGLTPTGRATIIKLQLNRNGVVNLRQLLRGQNLHPPNFKME